jgi:thiamine kinase-like enzyme
LHIAEQREATLRDTTLGEGVLHGDALLANTINTAAGLRLIDFDSVCYGPREWDLAPSLVAVKRFGRETESWTAFLGGYGIAPERLVHLEVASMVKQLSMTVVLCLQHGQSDAADREIARRISHWEKGDVSSRWYAPSDRASVSPSSLP